MATAYLGLGTNVGNKRGNLVTAAALLAERVGDVLCLKNKKLKSGKNLIKFFNKGNSPKDYPQKWEEFKNYCIMDVKCEREIREKLSKFPLSNEEELLYELDQEINDRGIGVDIDFVKEALICHENYKKIIKEKLYNLTKLDNVNSICQMKKFLAERNVKTDKLDKKSVEKLMKTCSDDICEILSLRKLLGKTSVRKYESIIKSVTKDERVHGLFQFYGANRTGRWAGRLVQVQNLPQNKMSNLEEVREKIRNEINTNFPSRKKNFNYDFNINSYLYNQENLSDILSQLIRTTFIPKKNHRFIIADFSAIEARIIAYLSDEKWRIDVFNTHGKIYEASASKMFKVDINEITKESELRQKGKIAELALGYQGGVKALVSMGAYNMNLCESELIEIVRAFRSSNTNIVKLWNTVEKAFIEAVNNKSIVHIDKNISFIYEGNILFIKLPSGRRLSYIRPKIDYNNAFNKSIITYEGVDSTTKKNTRLTTYGGKLVENIVQAIARDVLGEAMMNLRNKGFNIVMHVHDEIVLEVENGVSSVEKVCEIMCKENRYLKGLNLRADGFESNYYKK